MATLRLSSIMTIEEFRTIVADYHRIPRGTEVLTDGMSSQEDRAIGEAVKRYSSRLPLQGSATLTPVSGRLSLNEIEGWTAGWQVVDLFQGLRLPGNAWIKGVGGDGGPQIIVETSSPVQVIYSRPHTLDGEGSTIPDIDHEAVAHLAASLVLSQAANLYAQKKNSTIDADAIDYARLSGEYFMRSRDEAALYGSHMKSRVPKRSATVNWASRSRSGLGRMFQDDRYS